MQPVVTSGLHGTTSRYIRGSWSLLTETPIASHPPKPDRRPGLFVYDPPIRTAVLLSINALGLSAPVRSLSIRGVFEWSELTGREADHPHTGRPPALSQKRSLSVWLKLLCPRRGSTEPQVSRRDFRRGLTEDLLCTFFERENR